MARVTLRLPDWLHRQLAEESHAAGRSLNQHIVDALNRSVRGDGSPELTERERFRRALGKLALSDEQVAAMVGPIDPNRKVLSHEELQRLMPRLDPPLSQTIIEEREASPY